LIGNPRVMRAIRQTGQRLAAQKKNSALEGSPIGHGKSPRSAQQRQPLGSWARRFIGDRIRLHLDFERVRQRGVATRDRARHPHHMLAGRAFRGRGAARRAFGAAGKAQPVALCQSRHFASHFRVPRRSGWPKVRLPEFLQLFDAIVVQVNTVIALFPSCRAGHSRSALRLHFIQNPSRQNPYPAGRRKRAGVYAEHCDAKGLERRTRCRTRQAKSSISSDHAQESGLRLHIFRYISTKIAFATALKFNGRLTVPPPA